MYYSNFTLQANNITNTNPVVHAYRFDNSTIRMLGLTSYTSLSSVSTGSVGYICAFNCMMLLQSGASKVNPSYSYRFFGDGNVVFITTSRYNQLVNNFPNGIGFKESPSIFVTSTETKIL